MKPSRTLAALALGIGMALAPPCLAVSQQEADAKFAAQDWDGAADSYAELLRSEHDNASNWYNLGQARHQLGDASGARRAYQEALANNHPTPGRVRFNLARVLMTMGRREQAMREIQRLVGTVITRRLLLTAAEFAPLIDTPEFQAVVASQTCNTAEYHQFDFWLGEWDIVPTTPSAPAGGQNLVTKQQNGCVVQELYTNGGFTGTSINFYDFIRQVWHQTWMSNQGDMLYLEGGINADGAMDMSDRNLPSSATSGTINRTIWTPLAEGGLRQLWEVSSNNGATWSTVYDGRYAPRARPERECPC